MSTNKTTNYELNLWESGDDFLRSEFNADNAALDAAIAGKARVASGRFQGDGESTRDFLLESTPSAAIVFLSEGMTNAGNLVYGGISVETERTSNQGVSLIENGFRVYRTSHVNELNYSYRYLAFL